MATLNNKSSRSRTESDTLPGGYSAVKIDRTIQEEAINKNIVTYMFALSYYRWNLDKFADLFLDGDTGRRLHHDQRIMLRIMGRFQTFEGIFARSYSKTMLEVLSLILKGILYPGSHYALSAQTQQNAARILIAKYKDLIDFFPLLKLEVREAKLSEKDPSIVLLNGSIIDTLVNNENSKGSRRTALSIEESALIDEYTFQDALKPIPDQARVMCNKLGIANPMEIHRNINFFTTAYYKASSEYKRVMSILEGMINCDGSFILGASWRLNAWYGRGADRMNVQKNKDTMNPVSFDMNYESAFVGVSDDALVDMAKVLKIRTIETAEYEGEDGAEYYMAVDVARRVVKNSSTGCQTSVAVLKVTRKPDHRVEHADVVYIETIFGDENYTKQAIKIKKIRNKFQAQTCILDVNGLGIGLADELMKSQRGDGDTVYWAWGCINTDDIPETANAPKILYKLAPQSANSKIINTFIGGVNSEQLRLLKPRENGLVNDTLLDSSPDELLPYIHTEFLVQELSNLKLKISPNTNLLQVEQVVKRFGKDRYCSVAYALWYIKEFTDNIEDNESYSLEDYVFTL